MRGKEMDSYHAGKAIGITPAYAGKSGYWCDRRGCWQDHPRLCGEK